MPAAITNVTATMFCYNSIEITRNNARNSSTSENYGVFSCQFGTTVTYAMEHGQCYVVAYHGNKNEGINR